MEVEEDHRGEMGDEGEGNEFNGVQMLKRPLMNESLLY